MKCKNCNDNDVQKYSKYTSGEFCSRKCAMAFSTKENRKEISKKVSKTLTGSGNDKIKKVCLYCQKDFLVEYKKRNQKFCSISCNSKNNWTNPEFYKNLSEKISKRNSTGNFYFNSIKSEFDFKDKKIRCDSKKEHDFLDYICKNYEISDIQRNEHQLNYFYGSKNRTFTPDFKITIPKLGVALCECKAVISTNKTNKEVRPLYFFTVPAKKKSLVDFCNENNLLAIWWDKKMEILN